MPKITSISKIGYSNTKTKSLKVAVPKTIAQLLEVDNGDNVIWIANIDENGITINIEKKE